MTAAILIVKGALAVRGESSSILPADSSFIVQGFQRLLQRLAILESNGVVIPFTVPTKVTDDMLEPLDTTGPFIDILVPYLTGIQKKVTRDQNIVANMSLEFLTGKYLNAGVIPIKSFPNTTPRGAGNENGQPYINPFFPDPEGVLDNNQGVVNAPLGDS